MDVQCGSQLLDLVHGRSEHSRFNLADIGLAQIGLLSQLFLAPPERNTSTADVGAKDMAQLELSGFSHAAKTWAPALYCLLRIHNNLFVGVHLDETGPPKVQRIVRRRGGFPGARTF